MTPHLRQLLAQVAAIAAACASAQVPFSLDTTFRSSIMDQNVNDVLPFDEGSILFQAVFAS